MEKVKCDHCGLEFNKNDCIPCNWDEYNLTWYYCKKCNECFTKGSFIKFENGSVIEKLPNTEKVVSVRGQRSNLKVWEESN